MIDYRREWWCSSTHHGSRHPGFKKTGYEINLHSWLNFEHRQEFWILKFELLDKTTFLEWKPIFSSLEVFYQEMANWGTSDRKYINEALLVEILLKTWEPYLVNYFTSPERKSQVMWSHYTYNGEIMPVGKSYYDQDAAAKRYCPGHGGW